MLSAEEVQHAKAVITAGVTAIAIPTAWLAEIDSVLRIILTLVGIITGIYSALYYRKRLQER